MEDGYCNMIMGFLNLYFVMFQLPSAYIAFKNVASIIVSVAT